MIADTLLATSNGHLDPLPIPPRHQSPAPAPSPRLGGRGEGGVRGYDSFDPTHASPTPDSPFPTLSPDDARELLRQFIAADIPLPDLAASHGLTAAALLAFIDSPPIRAELEALTTLAAIQARTLAALAQPQAIHELREHLAAHAYTEDRTPVGPTLPAIALRARQRESARRSATTLLRPPSGSRTPRSWPHLKGGGAGGTAGSPASATSRGRFIGVPALGAHLIGESAQVIGAPRAPAGAFAEVSAPRERRSTGGEQDEGPQRRGPPFRRKDGAD